MIQLKYANNSKPLLYEVERAFVLLAVKPGVCCCRININGNYDDIKKN